MSTNRYEEVRLDAERARAEAQACLEAAERQLEEIAARLAELRNGALRASMDDRDAERHANEAVASLLLARDRDRRGHERAARAHDAAARRLEAAAAMCDRHQDRAGAERQRAAAARERQAAEHDRRAARGPRAA